ncbi:DUF805 domain-containing protein [Enemella evansiae]|nr:DUF805 domain-containing protein [Enemella evansiae]
MGGAPARPAVNFAQAIKLGFKNYANFYGRASKSEFWYWILFYVVASIVVGVIGGILNSVMGYPPGTTNLSTGETTPSGILSGIFSLALLLPWLAVGARRLHDTGRSGWLMALQIIPLVGIIIVLVLGSGDSNPEGAKYDKPDGTQPATE